MCNVPLLVVGFLVLLSPAVCLCLVARRGGKDAWWKDLALGFIYLPYAALIDSLFFLNRAWRKAVARGKL
jgi:hypothetical protein